MYALIILFIAKLVIQTILIIQETNECNSAVFSFFLIPIPSWLGDNKKLRIIGNSCYILFILIILELWIRGIPIFNWWIVEIISIWFFPTHFFRKSTAKIKKFNTLRFANRHCFLCLQNATHRIRPCQIFSLPPHRFFYEMFYLLEYLPMEGFVVKRIFVLREINKSCMNMPSAYEFFYLCRGNSVFKIAFLRKEFFVSF